MDDAVHVPGYTLGRQLGSGDFGVVFAAHEDSSGRPVAIKLLPIRSPQARSQAVREAALLAAIQHPHLVPIHRAVEMPDGIALVMDFAGGGSLADLLAAHGPLRPGEVVTVCAPIAQGLAEAHRHGVVHGMIKPANILFTIDGRPMLADVGVARLSQERRPGASGEGFAAPEVAAGRRPTPSADLYGMAATAVVALTGRMPGAPLALPGLPPATYGALANSLSNDPGRRPDAEAFANAVFALADPEPVELNGSPPRDEDVPADTGAEMPVISLDDEPHAEGRRARRSGRRGNAPSRDVEPEAADVTGDRAFGPAEVLDDDQDPGDKEAGGGRRIRRRDIIYGLAIVLALPVIALGVYVVWSQVFGDGELPLAGRADDPSGEVDDSSELCGGQYPAPEQQPPAPEDWTGVIENLYSERAQAFVELDSELLCDIYAPSHPRLAEDYEALRAYSDEDVHVEGLSFDVVTATLVSQESGLVTIEITDRISPYQLVNDQGEVLHDEPPSGDQTWQIELVPSADGASWRIG
jgi:serine/threonine protein kinase